MQELALYWAEILRSLRSKRLGPVGPEDKPQGRPRPPSVQDLRSALCPEDADTEDGDVEAWFDDVGGWDGERRAGPTQEGDE